MRISFLKGEQRRFLKEVMENSNCPSLRELENRIVGFSYSGLKNFFSERRSLPKELFDDLCILGKINQRDFSTEILKDYWGQSKGGKISRRK